MSDARTQTIVWQGWPHAPAPLGAILAARRDGGCAVVDDAGRPVPFGSWRLGVELLRGAWLRALDTALGTAAALLSGRRSPPLRDDRPGEGPVVLVVPILPDMSHTFVYREVLAMLDERPDWRVVALTHNQCSPVHDEARAVLQRATMLPREGITRRALRIARWLLRRPGRELFALYRAAAGGRTADLLGKNPLRDARHPGNAFALADLLAALPGGLPRHVHVYSSTYAANVVMGACHLLQVPFSISSYVDFEFHYAHKLLGEKLRRARFFRVVSQFCRQQLHTLPDLPPLDDARVPVVDFGLDVDAWNETATPPGRGVLVSAARLVPKKGFHLMPPALAALRAQGVPVRWRLLGDGPERERLQRLCEQHGVADLVDFLGACDNATVRRELLGADAAVLPCVLTDDGERDGIPVFLAEAMALCVPSVTTPVAGIPELVQHDVSGFLAPPGDVDALVATIAGVLNDRENAATVGKRGREAVLRKFDVRKTAPQLRACIDPGIDAAR
ncbi:MAG: glycosyltransferase family 4 protein [Planctomycetota bacterium]